jgi:hypothetical protein
MIEIFQPFGRRPVIKLDRSHAPRRPFDGFGFGLCFGRPVGLRFELRGFAHAQPISQEKRRRRPSHDADQS